MSNDSAPASPAWGPTTKLVVALTIVAIAAGLFIQFHSIIGPLIMAFVLAYLLHPVASVVQRGLHFSWSIAVGLIYILLLALLLGMLTLGGLGLVQQIESLVQLVQVNLSSLPDFIRSLSGQVYSFGPFRLDFQHLDLTQLSSQILGLIQPLLGGTGTLVTALASGAAQFLGWSLFVLLISYFVLAETGGLRGRLLRLDIPGYTEDIRRLTIELSRIWNAFLRGQFIVFLLTVFTYTFLLTVLGVRYALGVAVLAGLSKFLPYVGPFITWTTLAMVAYFQPANYVGLSPLPYAALTLALAMIVDQVFDNIVTPRIFAQTLKVHPAAVLVAAIIAANLLGLIGVIVAAPILATVALFWNYMMRKMLDLDPWPDDSETAAPGQLPSSPWARVRRLIQNLRRRRSKAPKKAAGSSGAAQGGPHVR